MTDLLPLKAQPMEGDELAAWFAGRTPRRLLAIPFTGPLAGRDLDQERFSPRTDIKAGWLDYRVIDWHHGQDQTMGRTELGKADRLGSFDGQDEPDEDGWWVDTWLKHGERRLGLIKRLVEKGGQLFGSSESVMGLVKKATDGEILVWPYWRQTLSTSPQNTHSVLRPLKAALEDAMPDLTPAFWADFSGELRSLGVSLRDPSATGENGAKAGRVLSSVNETDLDEALTVLLGSAEKLRSVLARHRKDPT